MFTVDMNLEDLTRDICRLVDDHNCWRSVLEIPQGGGFLDISSALQDDLSSVPVGAINQPETFPVGKCASFYRFDPEVYYGEESWPKLKNMLVNACRASGFRLATKYTSRRVTLHRKVTYDMCCSHGISIKLANGYIFDCDDVGASNVRKERIKHVKSVGAIRGMSFNFMFVLPIRTTNSSFANRTTHSFVSSVYAFIASICTTIFSCFSF